MVKYKFISCVENLQAKEVIISEQELIKDLFVISAYIDYV